MDEKAMYPPIAKAFSSHGFVAFQQFSFEHPLVKDYPDYSPVADLAAFRWAGSAAIDAVAVEAKPEAEPACPLWALTQATTYQLLFPSVYVACGTPAEKLSFAEGVLRALGLGYMSVHSKRASFIFPPVENARCYETHFLRQIRPAAVLALLADSLLDDPWTSNRSAGLWIWTENQNEVQVQFGLTGAAACCGLYSPTKWVCKALADEVDEKQLSGLLRQVPPEYGRLHVIEHAKCPPHGSLNTAACGHEKAGFDDTPGKIATAMAKAREWCSQSRHVGAFAVRYKLWDRDAFVTREKAEARVKPLLSHLKPIRDYLNGLL